MKLQIEAIKPLSFIVGQEPTEGQNGRVSCPIEMILMAGSE